MSDPINIQGLDKAEILSSLFNESKPQGMGFIHYKNRTMSKSEAEEILANTPSKFFDYLEGRVLKINLEGDELDPFLYDRDNGSGAAYQALSKHGLLSESEQNK